MFSLRHRFHIGCRAHLAPYPMGSGGYFPEAKRAGLKLTTHLHLCQG